MVKNWQDWNEDSSRDGAACRPDCHEEVDDEDSQTTRPLEHEVRSTWPEFVQVTCSTALHKRRHYPQNQTIHYRVQRDTISTARSQGNQLIRGHLFKTKAVGGVESVTRQNPKR